MILFHVPELRLETKIPTLNRFKGRTKALKFCISSNLPGAGGAINIINYHWVLSTIRYNAATKPEYKDLDNPFVQLSMGHVIRVTGQRHYLADLVELGILECDGKYMSGLKSLSYRFTPEYVDLEFKLYSGLHSLNVEEIKKSLGAPPENYQHVIDSMNHFQMNVDAAKKELQNAESSFKKRNQEMILAVIERSFTTKDFNFSINSTGRCFYIITNQKKTYRKYWTLCNEPVSISDVVSCQPAIVYSFYGEYQGEERELYKNLIESGGFYEFFQKSILDTNKLKIERSEIKKLIYRIWFGKERIREKKLVVIARETFNKNFPVLSKILSDMRQEDHCVIARSLQKTESDTMYNHIIPKIKGMNIPCLTIHDSVVVPKKYADLAAAILKEEFSRVIGIQATISTELF